MNSWYNVSLIRMSSDVNLIDDASILCFSLMICSFLIYWRVQQGWKYFYLTFLTDICIKENVFKLIQLNKYKRESHAFYRPGETNLFGMIIISELEINKKNIFFHFAFLDRSFFFILITNHPKHSYARSLDVCLY